MINLPKMLTDTFYKKNILFFIIMSCIIMQMLNIGWAYRFFAYANVVGVSIYAFCQYKASKNIIYSQWTKYSALFTFGFFVLHFIAVQNLVVIKEMRHILLAVFLMISTAVLDKNVEGYIRKNIFRFATLIIFIYVAVQATSLWIFNNPYGTTKNPHYLALYSSVGIIVSLYCFLNTSIKLKWVLGVCVLLLGTFLIQSASRPAWISLITSGLLSTYFLKKKSQLISILAIVLTLLVLTLTNVGGFAERSSALIKNVGTEERVAIWQETWKMQANSTLPEWIVGHGINTFEESYKPYSSYHLKNIDFNSPHNYLLELLYLSGWLGLLLAFCMFWAIYKKLVCSIMKEDEHKFIYITLLAVLTSSVVFASITLPFFTSYSMNIIALVVGSMFNLSKGENN